MAILGVLLGITMSANAFISWVVWKHRETLYKIQFDLIDANGRIEILERRRSIPAAPHTEDNSGPKPAANPPNFQRNRTWTEIKDNAEAGKESVKK